MTIAATIARILLGLLFTFAGAAAFFVTNPPPMPGVAGEFVAASYHSHYVLFVGFAQLVFGVLLLANRFVPLALIMLAAFIYNSFAFHVTMAQSGIFAPVTVTALWVLVALPYRAVFSPIFRPVHKQGGVTFVTPHNSSAPQGEQTTYKAAVER
jgi:putative oxidoreductase